MALPQTGIFALGAVSHAYLELHLAPSADPLAVSSAHYIIPSADRLAAFSVVG